MKINLYLCIEQKIKNTMEQTKRKTKKYQVISPDGFTIEFDKPFYRSMKKAKEAFEKWKQRYTKQGYYSSNRGRIPLNDLEQYCDFKVI